MLLLVETTKREVLKPPAVKVTMDGLSESDGDCFTVGVTATDNGTVPANAFRLTSMMVEFPVSPFLRVISLRLLPIVKVGVGDFVYVAI